MAGGDSWSFYVNDIAEQKECHILTLEPMIDRFSKPTEFPNSCKRVTVKACYDFPWWNGETPPTHRSDHFQALGFLRHAKLTHDPIMFGEVGEGFKRVKAEDACTIESRGLKLSEDNKAVWGVWSFYKWP